MKKSKMLFCGAMVFVFFMGVNSVWAGKITIKGSTTVLPIAQKLAEAYMKEFPDTRISISGGGSGNGIKAIIDGTTDIACASRFIKDKEMLVQLLLKNILYL